MSQVRSVDRFGSVRFGSVRFGLVQVQVRSRARARAWGVHGRNRTKTTRYSALGRNSWAAEGGKDTKKGCELYLYLLVMVVAGGSFYSLSLPLA